MDMDLDLDLGWLYNKSHKYKEITQAVWQTGSTKWRFGGHTPEKLKQLANKRKTNKKPLTNGRGNKSNRNNNNIARNDPGPST